MRAASAAVLTLLLLPFAVGDFWAYQLGLLYLYAIAALGIGLCWGRTGFLPLGQGTLLRPRRLPLGAGADRARRQRRG